MQSGDTQDSAVSDVIGTFVQLLSFDMSSDFNNDETTSTEVAEIFANVGGAFSSGWISSVYASQDFAATLSVGSKWNSNTSMWDQSTFILGFDISGPVPLPFSYAEIPGQPLNQYSVDLYQGHLRVVTSEWFWSETTSSTSNKIFVLKVPKADGSEGPEMLLTGKTDHVGKPNEQVMSVRFMEAKAYIVTFERTDPFYVFNLTDPSKPQKIGELEIPGFSSYLHPIEIDGVPLMLGIGSHVNETTGWETGLKISLFNVSDPMNLKEIAVLVDEGAYSSGRYVHEPYSATGDHRNQDHILTCLSSCIVLSHVNVPFFYTAGISNRSGTFHCRRSSFSLRQNILGQMLEILMGLLCMISRWIRLRQATIFNMPLLMTCTMDAGTVPICLLEALCFSQS